MTRITLAFLFLMPVLLISNQLLACTNYIITKGASADGSVMISYSADSHVLYGELYHWAPGVYPAGTMMDIYEWDTGKFKGQIPQANRVYNVVGNMNENQVAIGETTYGGREELFTQKGAIMDYGSLIYVALQRSRTAREAIQIIGQLMDEYGYASEGESFSIADKNEAWIMEIIGKGEDNKGAVWVAIRIPDGYVSAHANQARIQTFPLANGKTSITNKDIKKWNDPGIACIYSADVIEFARTKKWFEGIDKDFSFSDTYNPISFDGARFCEIRVWSMFREVNKDMEKYKEYVAGHDLKNRMPLYILPDHKITVKEMMHFMRNHLEGTEFDMTTDIGAGPFGCPYRWRPLTFDVDGQTYVNERATSTQQTGFSFVTQSRSTVPDEIGGVFWFSVDDAASTVYTPIYTSSRRVPETYARGNGKMMTWSDDAAFWVFNQVSNFAYTRYSAIHPEIELKQDSLENLYISRVSDIDKQAQILYTVDKIQAVEYVTDFSIKNANELVYFWKKFYQYLFMKYMDGNIKTFVPGEMNPDVKQPGYGEQWNKRIVNDNGEELKSVGEGGH
ncbi:MAG: dipeptidase [Bacteroidetes bacterium HGW-Bacteroidetes-6]|jgi:dipeptidase|nr:MAG: dipeptidase [Bacteroidetes bacterium HGW-Bacteroidetes-6]